MKMNRSTKCLNHGAECCIWLWCVSRTALTAVSHPSFRSYSQQKNQLFSVASLSSSVRLITAERSRVPSRKRKLQWENAKEEAGVTHEGRSNLQRKPPRCCMKQRNSDNDIGIRIWLLVLVVADNLILSQFHELKIARCSGNVFTMESTTTASSFQKCLSMCKN